MEQRSPVFDGNAARADRRNSRRKVLQLTAKVVLPGDRTFEAHTVDLSLGGASVETPVRLSPGQECVIHLDLSACGDAHQIVIVGRVCYCNASGVSRFRAGMQFVQLDDETANFIDTVLK